MRFARRFMRRPSVGSSFLMKIGSDEHKKRFCRDLLPATVASNLLH